MYVCGLKKAEFPQEMAYDCAVCLLPVTFQPIAQFHF